jgi:replicative DNA helicase
MARVDLHRLAWDYLTRDERERKQQAEKAFAKKRLVIFGSQQVDDWRLESVGEMARRLCGENQLKLLVIDDLMELHPRQPWTDTRSKMTLNTMGSFFKHLAEELQITVLACSGLSLRTNQRADCRPQSIDLAGFGLPQEFCSTVALTYRPSFVRPDIQGLERKAEITLMQTRTGRTGTLAMGWDEKFACFSEPTGSNG